MVGETPRLTWKTIPVVLLFGVGLPVGVVLGGRGVDRVLGLPSFPPHPFNLVLGVAWFLPGFYFALGSIYNLYRSGSGLPWGDVDPEAQSTRLVTDGLYRYTRNPMIFGTFCLIVGWGCVARSVTALVIFPSAFLVLLNVWVKNLEEPALEERFGEEYVAYKRRTPFLFPRPWCLLKKE